MRTKILSIITASLLSGSAYADCITQVDGMVPAGTRQLIRNGDTWVPNDTTTAANFEFQFRTEFTTNNGDAAVVVQIYAPGYSPSCLLRVFAKNDVVFY